MAQSTKVLDKTVVVALPAVAYIFELQELAGMTVTRRGHDFIEVDCGCTHNKYGDSDGKLTICKNGILEISCYCYPECKEDKLSPSEFEKHVGIPGKSIWRKHIWVFVDGYKVPLKNTKLLKYYRGSATDPSSSLKPRRKRTVHRDEFMKCTRCGKERRFARRTQGQCRRYHQAARASERWTCAHYPYRPITCDDKEERASKKRSNGCLSDNPSCLGCSQCVCVGCSMCSFQDCDCRTCVDFIQNSEPGGPVSFGIK